MKKNLVESTKIICNKAQSLIIPIIIILSVINLSFVASAVPNVVSISTYNSNFSNNTIGQNNSLNNTLIENDRIGVRLSSSTENQSNGLQNTNILNNSNTNPRNDLNCYTEGLFVCNESGECDNIKFDCLTECDDGITRTTGMCPDDDDRICWIEDEYVCNDKSGNVDNSSKLMNDNVTNITGKTRNLP
jgi:hypothetical protein